MARCSLAAAEAEVACCRAVPPGLVRQAAVPRLVVVVRPQRLQQPRAGVQPRRKRWVACRVKKVNDTKSVDRPVCLFLSRCRFGGGRSRGTACTRGAGARRRQSAGALFPSLTRRNGRRAVSTSGLGAKAHTLASRHTAPHRGSDFPSLSLFFLCAHAKPMLASLFVLPQITAGV